MPRPSLALSPKPMYREAIRQALTAAWTGRRFWVLSLLAGILMSAGSYDIVWRTFQRLQHEPTFLLIIPGLTFVQRLAANATSGATHVFSILGGIETLVVISLIVLAVAVISCAAQGGLVYALGNAKRSSLSAGEAFRAGSAGLWPIIVLNLFSLGSVWVLQILLHLPVVLGVPFHDLWRFSLYAAASVLFVLMAFSISILHIFTLNGMILQGSPLREALGRGYRLFKNNWLIVLETCLIQAAISVSIWLAFAIVFVVAMIPVFVLLVAAAMVDSSALFSFSLLTGVIIFLVSSLAVGGFTIQFQYATWTAVYRRLGEGGAMPKIHRLIRSILGQQTVPES